MNLLSKYRKTPEGTAVAAALTAGFLTHLFALVNVMHNIDDIGEQPYGYGGGLTSGRWFLSLTGDFFRALGGNCNLPFVNGVIFLVMIALAAGFLVAVFHIRSRKSAAFMGMLLAVFPTAASVLLYRFTSVYYGMSILLAVLAAWAAHRPRYGLVLSAFFLALSMGIYQAYVSITIGIFVLGLIQQALEGESTAWELVRRGLYDCLVLVLGLVLYFLCLKACLLLYGTTLSDYQGVNDMGRLTLGELPHLIWKAFSYFCKFPLTDYCGLAGSKLIKASYLLLGGVSAVMIGLILWLRVKKISVVLVTLGLCLVFPVAVNFVVIMCPNTWIYTIMMYSFALVGCVPLILIQCMPSLEGRQEKGRILLNKAVGVLLALLIVGYGYCTQINYTAMYYINRQMENYISSIVTQVRMTEGFTAEKQWALLGTVEDPLLNSPWQYETTYGGTFSLERMLNEGSRYYWFWNYAGYRMPSASPEAELELQNMQEVKSMPCWPSEGSVKVVGDYVVVKFQELS